jgi:Domain of unknown function (DUF929)
MGKAERIRRTNAREKIAAQQAAARRAESRRRMFLAGGSVLAVLVVVIVFIVAKGLSSPSASAGSAADANTASAVSKQITTVPVSTLDSVGKGSDVDPLTPTQGHPSLLTDNGKPEVLFMGEESCPYCGAERWALTVALSRFGTFSGLHYIHSASNDVYPDTPTLTFYHSTYSSPYVAFNPVEMYSEKVTASGDWAVLMQPTTIESALMTKYDAPPYVPSADANSYPFLDIGNQYIDVGAQYLPSVLHGLTWAQVAADIRNPNSAVAQGVDGAANSITAAICKITKDAPASVCTSSAAKAGAGSL